MDCTCFNNQHFTMAAKSKTKIDLKWRKSLDVGSKCEYKSKSDNKWIPAIISRIFRDEKNKEWIKINYGNPMRKKEVINHLIRNLFSLHMVLFIQKQNRLNVKNVE